MHIPKMLGSAPAPWWTINEDRDLLIGLCRYGYLQYAKLWTDPDLCFLQRFSGTIVPIEANPINEDDVDHEGETTMQIDEVEEHIDADGDVEMVGPEDSILDETAQVVIFLINDKASNVANDAVPEIPGATDVGIRIRRIVSALTKYRLSHMKKNIYQEPKIQNASKEEKIPHRGNDYFTRKHKLGTFNSKVRFSKGPSRFWCYS